MRLAYKYIQMAQNFLESQMSLDELKEIYLQEFKQDEQIYEEEVYEILNEFFLILEDYCSDRELADEKDTTYEEVVVGAKKLLEALR